jgi:SAM-dependent methyltransferase
MRPSELVKFRNDLVDRLEQLSLVNSIGEIIQKLNLTMSENFDIEAFSAHDKITQAVIDYQKILDQSEFVRNNLKSVIGDVDVKIDELANTLATSAKYNEYVNNEESISTFIIDSNTHQLIKDRMSHYVDHRFPGVRLGCRYFGQLEAGTRDHGLSIEYSNLLVANDPLYFYDAEEKSIETVTNHFNDVYKRRIRLYHDITQLPKQQFSFVFSWGVFNYLNLSIIESRLREIFDLLRPGGVAMFSYNNCDIVESARLFDMEEMSFVSKRNLSNILTQIGFEVIANYDLPNSDTLITNISWMEIRRPGKLETVKIKQVMGVVARK